MFSRANEPALTVEPAPTPSEELNQFPSEEPLDTTEDPWPTMTTEDPPTPATTAATPLTAIQDQPASDSSTSGVLGRCCCFIVLAGAAVAAFAHRRRRKVGR